MGWGGGGVVVVAHKILVSAQGPLVLVLGPGLDNIQYWQFKFGKCSPIKLKKSPNLLLLFNYDKAHSMNELSMNIYN